MKNIKIAIAVFLLSILFASLNATGVEGQKPIKYYPNGEQYRINETTSSMIIYGSKLPVYPYAYLDSQNSTKLEEIESIEGTSIYCKINKDDEADPDVESCDFDFTKNKAKATLIGNFIGEVPIKVEKNEFDTITKQVKRTFENKGTLTFDLIGEKKEILVDMNYDEILHIGEASTTISLNGNVTEMGDAMLYKLDPTVGYGGSSGGNLLGRSSGTSQIGRWWLNHTVQNNIPTGATILNISFKFYTQVNELNAGPVTLYFYNVTTPSEPTEGTASDTPGVMNWNQYKDSTNWATAGGDYDTSFSIGSIPVSTVDVSLQPYQTDLNASVFQGYLDGTNFGMFLVCPTCENSDGNRLYPATSEYATYYPTWYYEYDIITGDDCDYSGSGIWTIDESCIIDTITNAQNTNINIENGVTVTVNADVSNFNTIHMGASSVVTCQSGCFKD